MNRELLRQVKPVRVSLLYAIVSGMLIAITTVAQMVFLSTVVYRVFLGREGLEGVWPLLFLLLGAIVLHSGLLWLREVVTQRGAIRVKSTLRERLFAHLIQLGPGYTGPDDPDGEPRRRAHEEPVDRPLPDERAFPGRVAGPSHP